MERDTNALGSRHMNKDLTSKVRLTMKRRPILMMFAVPLIATIAACTGDSGDRGLGAKCSAGLDALQDELATSKAKGFGGTVAWGKAAALLTAGKTQQTFGAYENCLEKSVRGRQILRDAK